MWTLIWTRLEAQAGERDMNPHEATRWEQERARLRSSLERCLGLERLGPDFALERSEYSEPVDPMVAKAVRLWGSPLRASRRSPQEPWGPTATTARKTSSSRESSMATTGTFLPPHTCAMWPTGSKRKRPDANHRTDSIGMAPCTTALALSLIEAGV